MNLSTRELWVAVHGMVLGATYLLAFTGGLAELWALRSNIAIREETVNRIQRLLWITWIMAILCWLTVIVGTYIIYPWYRVNTPNSPQALLIANSSKAAWHSFGMEWKEHVAWLAPLLATAAAMLTTCYKEELADRNDIHKATLILFVIAFMAASIAGLFGAFITKIVPIS